MTTLHTNLGCRSVKWARGRGREWGCWGLGSGEDSWRSLSCSVRCLGQRSWGGSGMLSHPGNLKGNSKKLEKNEDDRIWIDQRWSCKSAFFKVIICYTKKRKKKQPKRSSSYLTGIPSNCHQPNSKWEEEFLKFLQGHGCISTCLVYLHTQ